MRRLLPIAAVLALAATLFHAPMAWACSCVADTTPQKQFKAADVVFVGSVGKVTTPDSTMGDVLAQMTVTQVYKGSVSVVAGVHTSANVAGCGVAFVVGSRYTVFASSTNGAYRAGLCGGTTSDVGVLARAGFHAGSPLAQVTTDKAVSPRAVGRTGPLAGAALLIVFVAIGLIIVGRARAGRAHRPAG
jgi:hypothetical protein